MRKIRSPVGITLVPMRRRRIRPGNRFGRRVVLGEPFYCKFRGHSESSVVYECDCGTIQAVPCIYLFKTDGQSCGCLGSETTAKRFTTHGMSKTKLHNIWCGMKTRCFRKTSSTYPYYGGRGIRVCLKWKDSFEAFRDWAIANGYQDGLEIDRRNTNGNYKPSNCRWATRSQQMRNTRKRRGAKTSSFKGVSWCANASKWQVQLCKDGKPLYCGLFDDETEAAKHYDQMAKKLYGAYAAPNF